MFSTSSGTRVPALPRLAAAQLANSVGDGAFYTTSALFFVQIAGLSAAQVGVALTAAWGVGALAGTPLGALADLRGPRGTAVLLAMATAASTAAFALASGFWAFLAVLCAYAAAQTGLAAARQALLAALVPPAERTAVRARLQAVLNAGLAMGAGLGGVALAVGTPAAYVAVFALDTVAFLLAAAVLHGLPGTRTETGTSTRTATGTETPGGHRLAPADVTAGGLAPMDVTAGAAAAPTTDRLHRSSGGPTRDPAGVLSVSRPAPDRDDASGAAAPPTPPAGPATPKPRPGRRFAVLADRPYAVLAGLNAVFLMYMPLLSVVLPLWIATRTDAPAWTIAVLFGLNTTAVALFQVRVARGIGDVTTAARRSRRAGWLLLGACAVLASSGAVEGWAAVAVLVVGAAVQVVGEMLQASAAWEISFGLAPEGAQGQYQGFFGTGVPLARMLGPAVLTALIITWGTPGWFVLGAVLAAAGTAMGPAVRWAERAAAERAGSSGLAKAA